MGTRVEASPRCGHMPPKGLRAPNGRQKVGSSQRMADRAADQRVVAGYDEKSLNSG